MKKASRVFQVFNVPKSDRFITVTYDSTGIVTNYNFSQGDLCGAIDGAGYPIVNLDLTNFIKWVTPKLDPGLLHIDQVDEAIWIYLSREMDLHNPF